jgi:hypothetical protein
MTTHKIMTGLTEDVPQWSPPLAGGTRTRDAKRSALEPVAAMEPATRGRDEQAKGQMNGKPAHAAMEPAPSGRDEVGKQLLRVFTQVWPQWSPPLAGGTRLAQCRLPLQP